MTKNVLSVGQCGPDTYAIRQLIEGNFDAKVATADLSTDALEKLRSGRFDLVLVNRKLDADYSDGVEVIKLIKADPELTGTPVMLVTNFPEHQQEAVAIGAEAGFGKLEYHQPQTHEKLRRHLDAKSG